jgi:hypothetical protein
MANNTAATPATIRSIKRLAVIGRTSDILKIP